MNFLICWWFPLKSYQYLSHSANAQSPGEANQFFWEMIIFVMKVTDFQFANFNCGQIKNIRS